jgi:glycosyltransferase involved in cell wall biosynthesis
MGKTKVSIITPAYNSEKYIENTILSVINQSYKNLQFIIVDGGSTDNTLKIVDKYKEKINIIISEQDKGMYDAINKGIRLADGEIIAYLNSDDLYNENCTIEKVVAFFEENPEIDWIYSDFHAINEKSEILNLTRIPKVKLEEFIASDWSYIPQPTTFWRSSIINKNNAFNDKYVMAADYEFFLRLLKSYKEKKVEFVIAKFRKHSESLSSTKQSISKAEMEDIKEKEGYCKNYNLYKCTFYVKYKLYNLRSYFCRVR